MRASSAVLRSLHVVAAIAYTFALAITTGCEIHVDIVDAGAADSGFLSPEEMGERCAPDEFDDDGRPQTPCIPYAVCQPGQYVSREPSAMEDRICSACKSGSFSTKLNASACKLWTNCAPGSHAENSPSSTQDRSCEACAEGSRTQGPNESICQPPALCPAGTARAAGSEDTACEPCSPGSYCAGGEAPGEECQDGRWDHDANPATECVERTHCLAGEYVATEGDKDNDRQCAACTSGHVSLDGNAQACRPFTVCEPGEYINVAGSARIDRACSPCAAGSFSTTENATSCERYRTCEAGSYVHSEGTSTRDRVCVGCASGHYTATSNSAECQAWSHCEPGTRVMNEPSPSVDRRCEACGDSSTTYGDNWSVCVSRNQCPAGTFEEKPSQGDEPPVCEPCPVGTFCAGGSSIVIECQDGTWDHDADPATSCVARSACLAGEYVTSDGSAHSDRACSPCPRGTYTSSINEPACAVWAACAAGTYVSQMGGALHDRVCVDCPSGSFSAADNANSCTRQSDCGPGQFISGGGDATSDRSCAGCSSGSFSTFVNMSECTTWQQCEAGHYVTNTPSNTTDRACEPCAQGAFSEQANQSSCTASDACRPGSLEVVPGDASRDPTCELCEAGTYCAGNKAPKVPCAPGTWDHDANAATSCVAQTLCSTGQFVSKAGSPSEDRECRSCAAGSFSAGSNRSACNPWSTCPPGHFVRHAGDPKTDRACAPCAAGSFSTLDNSSACAAVRDCVAGQRVSTAPSASSDRSCAGCDQGTYSNVANALQCSPWTRCTAGRYASAAGSSTDNRLCSDCAPGSFSAADNAPRCQAWATCLPGTRISQSGTTTSDRSCQSCDAGSFSVANNTLSCAAFRECGDGMFASTPGTSTSDRMCSPWSACPPGTYVAADGSESGDRSCNECGAGRFSTSTNASACAAWSECAAGTFVSTSPSATQDRSCSPCADGTFSESGNQPSCKTWRACAPNEEVSAPGSNTSDRQCRAVEAPQPNLLWLDASDLSTVTKNGANRVSEWRDKSVRARHADVPAGSEGPLWREYAGPGAMPEIEFNGEDVRLQTASLSTAPELSVFVVFKLSSPQTWGSILNQGHDAFFSIRVSGGNLNFQVGDRNDAPLLSPNLGTHQVLTTFQGAGVASMYYHASRVASTTAPNISAGNAPITIGNAQLEPQSMGGTIAEIRAYDYVLSAPQRYVVEQQLKEKYILGYSSCAEILSQHSTAISGAYTIDPDGAGDMPPARVMCDMTDGGWQVIATDDFTTGAPGWNPSTRSSCGPIGDVLGGVGILRRGSVAQKTYDLSAWPHSQIRLSLDFIKIGEWSSEDAFVTVDGMPFFERTFSASEGVDACGDATPEQVEYVDSPFEHTADSLTVRVTTTLDNSTSSEAFALDNVVVRVRE